MQISFLADNATTRKNARMIYTQFFPFYIHNMWLQGLGLGVLAFVFWQFISLAFVSDTSAFMQSWGFSEAFSEWPFSPLVLGVAVMALVFALATLMRVLRASSDRKFAAIAPPEQAEVDVTETEVTMTSASATVRVPLAKITGLALNKEALAIGFSGAGMIVPRSAFASPADETAFLRALAKGMGAEALQRSSEAVKSLF